MGTRLVSRDDFFHFFNEEINGRFRDFFAVLVDDKNLLCRKRFPVPPVKNTDGDVALMGDLRGLSQKMVNNRL